MSVTPDIRRLNMNTVCLAPEYFCPADCEHLSITEYQQNMRKKDGIHENHWCNKYDCRLHHLSAHPRLYKCKQCFEGREKPAKALEEKVDYLEDKLARTIEVLKLLVQVDNGLGKDTTEWLLEQVEELQEWKD
jgi:hypothetical protein